MKDVGIGIIGVGRLGYVHAHNLSRQVPRARLVGVCELDEKLGRKTANEFGSKYYKDLNRMLEAKDVDAVCVVTATPHHVQPVAAVAQAGKPLFCEKPLASTLEDTKRLVTVIKQSGIQCQIGFQRRFDPDFGEGEKLIRAGAIGRPVFVGGYSRDPFPPPPTSCDPSKGGGLFFDMMLHDFDMARFLMKDDVDCVYADESNLVVDGKGIHRFSDNATAHLRFKKGGLANFHGSWHAWYGYDIRTEVHGSEGSILMGGFNSHEITLCLKEKGITKPMTFQTVGKIPHFMYRFKEAYIREMIAFVDCVLDDKAPMVNEDDALAAFRIAIAADQSASGKKPVSLDEI
jgi:scyllo-inositol 2-dehydrogenase (NAD+)